MKIPKTNLALQLYTLRDFLKTPEDMDKTFARVRKIGYQAVQVSGIGPIEPEKLAELLEKHGLYCCAMHEGLEGLLNNFEAIVKKMKTVGCTFTALGAAPMEYRSEEGMKKLLPILSDLGKRFNKHGITFGYHNHKFEFERLGKTTMLEQIMKGCKPEVLAMELDTYWVQYGGGDVVDWITKVKGRMPVAHIKDYSIIRVEGKDEVMMCEIGEGNLNWKRIFKALKATKVRWWAVEQDRCLRDPFESIEISFKNLKKMGIK